MPPGATVEEGVFELVDEDDEVEEEDDEDEGTAETLATAASTPRFAARFFIFRNREKTVPGVDP